MGARVVVGLVACVSVTRCARVCAKGVGEGKGGAGVEAEREWRCWKEGREKRANGGRGGGEWRRWRRRCVYCKAAVDICGLLDLSRTLRLSSG